MMMMSCNKEFYEWCVVFEVIGELNNAEFNPIRGEIIMFALLCIRSIEISNKTNLLLPTPAYCTPPPPKSNFSNILFTQSLYEVNVRTSIGHIALTLMPVSQITYTLQAFSFRLWRDEDVKRTCNILRL